MKTAMTSRGFEDEIPKRAFIDAQVLQHAVATGMVNPAIDLVSLKHGLENYRLLGPAHAVGLLYCLIVVPHERAWSPELLRRLEGHNPIARFSFIGPTPSVEQLIRHLRNSIAHADFTVSANGTFTFNDHRRDGTRATTFLASIELVQLEAFLSTVGAEMANVADSTRE
jgi:HEPN family protein